MKHANAKPNKATPALPTNFAAPLLALLEVAGAEDEVGVADDVTTTTVVEAVTVSLLEVEVPTDELLAYDVCEVVFPLMTIEEYDPDSIPLLLLLCQFLNNELHALDTRRLT